MARTPDLAGAVQAVVARTLKTALGPRLRGINSQLRRLEKRLRKLAAIRKRVPKRRAAARRARRRRAGARGRR